MLYVQYEMFTLFLNVEINDLFQFTSRQIYIYLESLFAISELVDMLTNHGIIWYFLAKHGAKWNASSFVL